MSEENFYGFIYSDGYYKQAICIEGFMTVRNFIKLHLFEEELKICDSSDRLLLHIVNGVDLVNNLNEIGIDLSELFESSRQDLFLKEKENKSKQEWEIQYDRIGLSPGEIKMRQRVKLLAKTARTITDVANLLRDTYFDAHFISPDDINFWCYFDDMDFSVTQFKKVESVSEDFWMEVQSKVYLQSTAIIQHRYSSEDKHVFTLFDPPG